MLQGEAVFLSPPWGGPAYKHSGIFDVSEGLGETAHNLSQMMAAAAKALRDPASQRVACFLPRNTGLRALGSSLPGAAEMERNVLNGFVKAITIYTGTLAA